MASGVFRRGGDPHLPGADRVYFNRLFGENSVSQMRSRVFQTKK
jgi:hypothetical protein